MSLYSLGTQTSHKHYLKHKENLLNLSDKEYVNSHFLLGEKVNKKEQIFSTIMLELFCTNNCELNKFIDDKLQGVGNN